MTVRRGLLILPILAALLGVPSAALAAPPNALAAPSVSPLVGSTATTFIFSVQYVSTGGNAATGVTVSVAGRTWAMRLTAGTSTSGTWTASSTLPAGSWPVAFRAAAAKGPQPSANGPIVSVVAAPVATAPPPPPPAPARTATPAPSRQASVEQGTGTATPTTGPAPGAPAATPRPDASTPTGPGASGTPGSAEPAHVASEGTRPAGGTTASAAPGGGSGAVSRAPGAVAAESSDALPVGRARSSAAPVMLLGMVAVAAVALAGTAWLLLAGRRRGDELDPMRVGSPQPAALPRNMAATDQLLSRRGRRRSRIQATDDPVLASMGLDEPAEGRPRAAQVHRGAGMRDASRRRARD